MLNYRNVNIAFGTLLIMFIILDWRLGISNWYYFSLIFLYLILHVYGCMFVTAQFFTPIKCYGNRKQNTIAITFDDGPLPRMTELVLEILKTHQVKATFFCIGNRIESHPEILIKVHQHGHAIGNHTFLHGKFFDLQSTTKMQEELTLTDNAIKKVIGQQPRFFRPPYGITNPNLARAIRVGGYVTMGWSVRSFDTITDDETKLFNRVVKKLRSGDIILFHDYCQSTINILPRLLEYINEIGLKVVRLDELLNEKAYV